ncbi:MAG TPA: hypothetical protein VIE91_06140 [Methylophilaceae bacterium]
MSYLDDLGKISVLDFLKQACHRIDGVVMYLVCALFALFSGYSALADWLGFPLPLSVSNRNDFWWITLSFVPIIFVQYVFLVWNSTPGEGWISSHFFNAIFLLIIPFYAAYIFNFFD